MAVEVRPAPGASATHVRAPSRRELLTIGGPLAIAAALSLYIYWPSFVAGFDSDDYIYLHSVRSLTFGHYLRASLVPTYDDPVLILTRNFWRPLYYLSFQGTVRLFGDEVVPYHVINFGIHLASVVMVWAVTWHLVRRWGAAGIAAILFAAHPAGFESVAWVSSSNTVALPLGLGAWLAFMCAVESPGERRTWLHALSLSLMVVALGFRETAGFFFIAMGLWYVAVPARAGRFQWRTYLPLAPYAALAVLFLLVRTQFFTEPASKDPTYEIDREVPRQFGYLLRLTFSSLTEFDGEWYKLVTAGLALGVLAVIPVALFLRQWLLAVLVALFAASLVPYSVLFLGAAPRYFYFPAAFLAIAAGVGLTELMDWLRPRASAWVVAAPWGAVVVVAVLGTVTGHRQVERWVDEGPDVYAAWTQQLQRDVPDIPEGGTLYVVNTPLRLALFEGANLPATVGSYYPGVGRVVIVEPQDAELVRVGLGQNERLFVFDPSVLDRD